MLPCNFPFTLYSARTPAEKFIVIHSGGLLVESCRLLSLRRTSQLIIALYIEREKKNQSELGQHFFFYGYITVPKLLTCSTQLGRLK